MNFFFRPYVETLRRLSTEGVNWFNHKINKNVKSIVIAPIASCDAPARSEVQNLMYSNGEYGCFVCEVQGESSAIGKGHNMSFIPDPKNPPVRRTKERMLLQAKESIRLGLDHVMGVNGPAVVSLIPYFDLSISFVPDYVHIILLGIFRLLLSLWFDSKYHAEDWYIKKDQKDKLNRNLLDIKPPDTTMRTPRSLEERPFFKANEIEALFLHYFPILLRDKLKKQYYQHFLLIVYAIHYLSKPIIHRREIDHAQFLIDLFLKDMAKLYGPERITYNPHVASHICEYVRMYGSISFWNTYDFEDFNGFIKSIIHGTNKIDAEIVNTIKICNSYQILNHLISKDAEKTDEKNETQTKLPESKLNIVEKGKITEYCNVKHLDLKSVTFHSRINTHKVVYTSQKYVNQKKRDNSQICWENKEDGSVDLKYGIIELFFKSSDKTFALVRELIPCQDNTSLFNNFVRFPKIHVLVRSTYCLHVIKLEDIKCKLIRVKDYVCVPAFTAKK